VTRATFAAGCFWAVEAVFRKCPGVVSTQAGYMGGEFEHPTAADVNSGRTGHAEAVDLEFDENVMSYDQLLDVFWECHDPTSLNRQGTDIGPQYRSAIFCHTPEQRTAATQSRDRLQARGKLTRRIVTQIVSASTFWRAEERHQRYLERHGEGGSAQAIC